MTSQNDEIKPQISQDTTPAEDNGSLGQRRQVLTQESPSAEPKPAGDERTLLDIARDAGVIAPLRTAPDGFNRNPNGKGGFRDHPENRSKGGRKKIPQSQRELKALLAEIADEPADESEVQRLVEMLRKMFASKSPVDHMEILNRLVGRQASKVDMTSGGQKIGWNAFIQLTVAPSLPATDGADDFIDATAEDTPEPDDAADGADRQLTAGTGSQQAETGSTLPEAIAATTDRAAAVQAGSALPAATQTIDTTQGVNVQAVHADGQDGQRSAQPDATRSTDEGATPTAEGAHE